jgi:hypothetical protein
MVPPNRTPLAPLDIMNSTMSTSRNGRIETLFLEPWQPSAEQGNLSRRRRGSRDSTHTSSSSKKMAVNKKSQPPSSFKSFSKKLTFYLLDYLRLCVDSDEYFE